MRYIIYGAGAVGGSIGARLHQHGREVVLICRGAHLEAVRRDGLTLQAPEGTAALPIPATGSPAGLRFGPEDVVLLTVKSQDTARALDDLRAAAGDVPVVCAQNGVANERMALRRFSRVYAMVVLLPATHLEPGVVTLHAGPVGGVLDAGRYPEGTDPLIQQVTADLSAAGFSARPDPHVMRLKYAKLVQNLGNAVQALCPPGPETAELLRLVREEALACYRAAGIQPGDLEAVRRERGMRAAPRGEGSTRLGSSTWQSLARGTGSVETDYLNGEIALLGALHGVPTPYNRLIQQVSAQAAREGHPPGSYDAAELLARGRAGG
ncbi:MAG TPA: 2-dehydropantoate 2-reductase [Dehalococcoidia bacterium]